MSCASTSSRLKLERRAKEEEVSTVKVGPTRPRPICASDAVLLREDGSAFKLWGAGQSFY